MTNPTEHERGGLSRFCSEPTEWNALVCSIAFFLIFTAFGTVQNYATSTGDDGAYSLGILYIVLTFSNIIMPFSLQYISSKWAMFLGAATYAIYVAANIKVYTATLFASAALMGAGAALLWVAQGVFITQCAHEYEQKYNLPRNSQLGYYNGLFWAWMVLNQAVGNGIAAMLVSPSLDLPITIVYIVFTSINVAGVCIFLLIKPFDSDRAPSIVSSERNDSVQSAADYQNPQLPIQRNDLMNAADLSARKNGDHSYPSPAADQPIPPQPEGEKQRSRAKKKKTTMSEIETIPFIDPEMDVAEKPQTVNIWTMLSLWTTKQQLLLIPFTLYSGISQAFEYGNFPAQINDDFHKFSALAIFGVVDAACSLLFGRLSDKIGRLPVLTIAFIAHGTVYIYFFVYSTVIEHDMSESAQDIGKMQHDWWDFFVVAVFLGIGDAGFNTQMYALYGSLLGEKSEVFANLKFWQSIAMTWGFLSNGVHERWDIVLISCFALLVCAALPLYCSKEVRRKSAPQKAGLSFS